MRMLIPILFLISCATTQPLVTPCPSCPPARVIRDTTYLTKTIHDTPTYRVQLSDSGGYNLFPTGLDCSSQIQFMWDRNIIVRPAPGTYYIDHPVYGWRFGTNGFSQFSGAIIGPYNAKNSPNYMNAVFYCRQRDSSAFYVQKGKGVLIKNIAIYGSYRRPNQIGPYQIATMRYADWADGGPEYYAAVAVDAFNDPSGNRAGSTGVDVIGCQIRNFMEGITYEVGSNIQNGDECNVIDCEIDYCKICLDYGQVQTKGDVVKRLKVWGGVHTVISTGLHGMGCMPFIDGVNVAGGVYELFYCPSGGRFTGGAYNIYAEMLFKIGFIGGRPTPGIYNSTFDFMNIGWWPDYLILGDANFYDCQLRYYNEQVNKLFLVSFAGKFTGGAMEMPITAGIWQNGVYSDTPRFQNVREFDYDGGAGKAAFINSATDNAVMLKRNAQGTILSIDSVNYLMTVQLPDTGLVKVGDYLLSGLEGFRCYDQQLYSLQQSTTYVGRVHSISGNTAVLDQVGICMLGRTGQKIYFYKSL